jgi:putative FmdB family regulatory protein
MPTYDYLCTACGHKFEEIQKMSDPALTKCPKCKGKIKRLIGGGVGIIFKGSGFYATDSRKTSSAMKPDAKPDSKSESKPDSKSDSKSDSRSDSRSDSTSEAKKESPKADSAAKSSESKGAGGESSKK